MERKALRYLLYFVAACGTIGAIADSRDSKGNPADSILCAVVAAAGLAASARPDAPSPKPPDDRGPWIPRG